MNFPPPYPKTKHGIPVCFLRSFIIPLFSCFGKKTFYRILATGTRFVLIVRTLIACRDLGGQERWKMNLPERRVYPALFEKTPDMPRRILHTYS
jgi:hypothetical protein